jgi:serine/arginine repetitive matrix protein 1
VCGCLFQEVDGKHVQIQLTGFMEKNTGRFMKELWILLTSAQKNLSGIPQEFLDVKAEEQRLKKAENDRIVFELQRKREQEKEAEQERLRELEAARELEKGAGGGKKSPTDDIDMKSSEIRKAGHNSGRGSSGYRESDKRSYRARSRSPNRSWSRYVSLQFSSFSSLDFLPLLL